MLYRFEALELDRATCELRRDGAVVPVEPQVFALLLLLVENRDRLVSRDEIIEKVWDGRVVSDSALDSRVKSARRAVGDDGKQQRLVRTVHGRGFRFVGEVREAASAARAVAVEAARGDAPPADAAARPAPDPRPSIAVLPFRPVDARGRLAELSDAPDAARSDAPNAARAGAPHAGLADALADELIGELSRLRSLFVIARGSSFRFRSAAPDPAEVGRVLGVRYCLSGSVALDGSELAIRVELVDTRDGGVVWGDRFVSALADVHATRAAILARIVAALDLRISLHAAQAARLVAPESLDAWSAYHLGLQHMFRFHRGDNAAAGALFARALTLEPGFARAHAGLSFVQFQNAFLGYVPDVATAVQEARRAAERSVELDPLDPFANLTMGRSFWLEGDLDTGLGWLERATAISPSYAQGIYARAWTHALSGRGDAGKHDADLAMALSPLDPLHYAMSATRALSHVVCDETAEAAAWAERAAHAPGAHVLIAVIAAAAHVLNGDRARAEAWAVRIRARNGAVTAAAFFRSFPFADARTRARLAGALAALGL